MGSHRRLTVRVGLLLALVLCALIVARVAAFTNGQAASLVLGQTSFTTNTGTTSASGMNVPFSVIIDPTSGKVFVADFLNSRVLRFASGATLANGVPAEAVLGQATFTTKAAATTATGMSTPASLALDSSGRLWVLDGGNNRVLRFDNAATLPNGAAADGVLGQTTFTTTAAATTATGMNTPRGLAVDSTGNLWVADSSNNRVLRFDNAATLPNGAAANGVLGQATFTTKATATTASGMFAPTGLALDSTDRLWVADHYNNRVLRFDNAAMLPNGAAANGVLGQATFTTSTAATTATGMNAPLDLAVDSTGNLWVADSSNNRVLRFDKPAQTITFGVLAGKMLGDTPFMLSATASSGLAVTFTSTTPAVCTVSGSTVMLVTTGTCTIAADQAGDSQYTAAPQVTQSFTIAQATQSITFAALAAKTIGDSAFDVSATASSGLATTFTSTTPAVCTMSGSTVTLVTAGICIVTASQPGNATYSAASPVTQSFTVAAAPVHTLYIYLPLVTQ